MTAVNAKPALTRDQQLATRVDVTTWVGASAGTGKTHVLAARVLGLMVTGTPPENILCLTYTRAAAAEMANRIYDKLGDWAVEREEVLQSEILRTTGIEANEQQCQDARTLFARVLEIPGGLKIQTIHSFCQTILKRFPLEAGLSPHFQVMDDRTAGEFLKTASDDIMRISAKLPHLARAFDVIAASSTETRFEKLIGAFIAKRGQLKRLLDAYGGEDGLVAAVYKALKIRQSDTSKKILEAAIVDQNFDKKSLLVLVDTLVSGKGREHDFGTIFQNHLKENKPTPDALLAYMNGFIKSDGNGFSTDYVFKAATLKAHPEFENIYKAEQKRLLKTRERLALLQVAQNSEALVRISVALLQAFETRKRVFGYLDYEDLVLETDRLLHKPAVAQWILYKLDGRIDHILVDEAQDTNLVQWRLVEAIGDEFTAGFGAKDELERTIFAVGDIKQAIFSFQGSEPKEFHAARGRIEKKVLAARKKFAGLTLDLSFRSTTAVLELVDSVIAQPDAKNGITEVNEDIRHRAQRAGHAGLVELWPPEGPDQKENPPPGWQLPLVQKFSHRPDARLAAKIARKIDDMVTKGEVLQSRGRPVRYGDILVLLKTRGDFQGHLVRELKTLGVPVAGSDRMVLSEQLVIEDLLALARFVLLPDDDYTLACILKGPLAGLNDEMLFTLAHKRKGSLWQALKRNKKHTRIHGWLSDLLGRTDFITPFEFFSGILNQNGGRRKFVARLGPEVNDPVDEFLTLAQDFEKTHSPSLQSFLRWFEAAQTDVKRDMERAGNQVRIMTIHGAKGLEAPVVFLPDTFQAPQKRPEDLYQLPAEHGPLLVWSARRELDVGPLKNARAAFENELREEYNRLLYVALTRAEDQLYIAGWQNRATSTKTWYSIIEDAMKVLAGVKSVALEDGSQALRYENTQTAAPVEKEREKPIQKEAIQLPAWALRSPKAKEATADWLQPSRAAAKPTHKAGDEGGRVRGIIIHKLLEVLPEIKPSERDAKARAYMRPFDLPEKDQMDILKSVLAILEHRDFSDIFGPGSLAEASLVGVVEGNKVAGQVDRLVIKKDEILIIDYKSDREVPKTAREVNPAYREQLRLYTRLLQHMYPDRIVRAALLWTVTCQLMPLFACTKMSKSAS